MKALFLICILFCSVVLFGQNFPVNQIPDSLKKNANVVLRYEEYILEIKTPAKAVVKERHVYSILNEEGQEFGKYLSAYDQFSSINYIAGYLFDEAGKEIKHVKKKDLQDITIDDQMSLMVDTRYKVNDFYYRSYPYTVDYEEEDELNGILDFPDWNPMRAAGMSVQNSKYVIIAPKNYLVRYKQNNYSKPPVIVDLGDKKSYTWEINNLPPLKEERLEPPFRELVPNIMFAPSDFEAQGYMGNMNNWENYGKFIYQLTQGRDVLPDVIKAKVHELTDGVKDQRKKVSILYDYLQKTTHYISIQLGIGGLQPFDANYVGTKKYGDCKALSNFMVALLKEAGVKANYVEIMAGDDAPTMVEDFPSFQSNHVIACVPLAGDTLWLECTSQTKSAGFMGSFTGDRKAIIIDAEGAHIVRTPVYSAADNLQSRVVNASIDNEGNLDANVNTRFTGIQQETPNALIHEVSKEFREKYLNRVINLPTYQVTKSDYSEIKGVIPEVKENLHILSPGYANITGKRLFIVPNLFNRTGTRFSADSVRKYDIVYSSSFRDIDSIFIKIPEGYTVESMPAVVQLDSRFGKYSTLVKLDGNQIVYIRMQERSRSRFPKTDYQDLVKFQEQIYKSDHSKMVLVKKVE